MSPPDAAELNAEAATIVDGAFVAAGRDLADMGVGWTHTTHHMTAEGCRFEMWEHDSMPVEIGHFVADVPDCRTAWWVSATAFGPGHEEWEIKYDVADKLRALATAIALGAAGIIARGEQ